MVPVMMVLPTGPRILELKWSSNNSNTVVLRHIGETEF
jgi:hypothetical protein